MLDGDRSGVLRREGWVAFVWADGDDESPTHEIEIKPLTDLGWKGDES